MMRARFVPQVSDAGSRTRDIDAETSSPRHQEEAWRSGPPDASSNGVAPFRCRKGPPHLNTAEIRHRRERAAAGSDHSALSTQPCRASTLLTAADYRHHALCNRVGLVGMPACRTRELAEFERSALDEIPPVVAAIYILRAREAFLTLSRERPAAIRGLPA